VQVSAIFAKISCIMSQLGSGSHLVCRIGSGARVT